MLSNKKGMLNYKVFMKLIRQLAEYESAHEVCLPEEIECYINKYEAILYYCDRTLAHKKTGYLFQIIPYPPGKLFPFTISTIVIFAFFASYFHAPVTLFLISAILCWEHFITYLLRGQVLTDCLLQEIDWHEGLIEDSKDGYVIPFGENVVTEDDRDGIFDDHLFTWRSKRNKPFSYHKRNFIKYRRTLIQNIKTHYLYIIFITVLYWLLYTIILGIKHLMVYSLSISSVYCQY